ncbi:O-antigen ligase family protein [bacterium]|nr:O-antigen ligase family protein [bacterium]
MLNKKNLDICDQIIEKGLIGLVFFLPLVFNPYLNDVFSLPKACLFICFLLILGTTWLIKTTETATIILPIISLKKPLNIAILVYFISILAAVLYSTNIYISLWGMYLFYFEGFICISGCIFLYFLVINNLSFHKIEKIISFLFIGGALVSLYGIFQHFGLDFVKWSFSPQERVCSTLGNPNFLGAYLIMLVPLTLSRIIKKVKIYYLLLLLLFFTCLIFTYSRAAWLGLSGSILLWIILTRKIILFYVPKKILYLTGIIILFIIVFLSFYKLTPRKNLHSNIFSPVIERINSITNLKERDIASRLSGWKSCLKMIKNNPILGMGQDTFGINFRRYMSPAYETFSRRNVNAGYAHNEFLQIIVTRGIIGLIIYLFLLFTFFKTGIKIINKKDLSLTYSVKNSDQKPGRLYYTGLEIKLLTAGLMSSAAALLIQNQFSFSILTTSVIFWLLVSFISIIEKETSIHPVTQNEEPPMFSLIRIKLPYLLNLKAVKYPLYSVTCITTLILILFAFRIYQADRYFKSGMFLSTKKIYDRAIEKYKKAVQLNPYQAIYHQNFAKAYQDKALFTRDNKEKRLILNQAITEYKKYIKLIPQDALGYNGLGVTYVYLGKLNEQFFNPAIINFQKAIMLDPYFIEPYTNMGSTYYLQGNTKLAISTLENSLNINPRVALTHFNLGIMYALEKKNQKAINCWQETLKIDPNFTDAKIHLDTLKKTIEKGGK